MDVVRESRSFPLSVVSVSMDMLISSEEACSVFDVCESDDMDVVDVEEEEAEAEDDDIEEEEEADDESLWK